jgi:hypothetical protein
VPAIVPVLIKAWAIGVPVPADEPVIIALAEAIQLNVVPATPPVMAIPVVCPEQIVCGAATALGVGFTVAITVIAVPGQLLGAGPVGVIV